MSVCVCTVPFATALQRDQVTLSPTNAAAAAASGESFEKCTERGMLVVAT
jgi:hypothetical protein